MGVPVTPRKGAQSAATAAPKPDVSRLGQTTKSAPTKAPNVRSTRAPSKNGDWETPASVKSNIVEPRAPVKGSKDPNIGRTP